MAEVIGEFTQCQGEVNEGLELTFSPSSVPLKHRWRNNGLSADFLADYVTTFFPRNEDDPASLARQADIRGAVNYIANELLENAMKYSDELLARPTTIRLVLTADAILFTGANATSAEHGRAFRRFVDELTTSDPADMYVRQLERAAEGGGSSGLGLLTMINDYGARLAWQFDDLPGGGMKVTTQVRLDIE
ncbi:MAG: slr1658 superfamily regulator [Bacteroidales bacterium]|jgi:hypothetical protein